MSEPVLLVDKSDGVAILALNRPGSLDALSRELRGDLVRSLRELSDSPEAQVVILTGAGRAFCAGLDLKELGGDERSSSEGVSDDEVIDCITGFPGPVIGAINGHAVTGGFEIALACDVLVGSTEARFAERSARRA